MKRKNWLPFEAARKIIQAYNLTSRKEFLEWFEKENPNWMSKTPDKVAPWIPEWSGWADFLGYDKKEKPDLRRYRGFFEAAWYASQCARAFTFSTSSQWFEFFDTHVMPADIPRDPSIYPEWKGNGWKVWLGKTTDIAKKVEIAQEVEKAKEEPVKGVPSQIVLGFNSPNQSYQITRTEDSQLGLDELGQGFKVIKRYHDESSPEMLRKVQEAVKEHMTSGSIGNVLNSSFMSNNISEITFELDTILRPKF